jgi:hypothetical protein
MAIFGGKEIAALRAELDGVRAELAAMRAGREEASRQVFALQSELQHAREKLQTGAARLERLGVGKRATPARQESRAAVWEVVDGEIVRGRFVVEGTEEQLGTFERMLKIMVTAGEIGSTLFFDVLVDGDGAARLKAWRDGHELALSQAETRAWLLGEDEAEVAGEIRRSDGVLCVEFT